MTSSRESRKTQWLVEYEIVAADIAKLKVGATKQKKLQADLITLHAQILTYNNNPGYYKDIIAGFGQLNTVIEQSKKNTPTPQNNNPAQLIPHLQQASQVKTPAQSTSLTLGGCLTLFSCIATIEDDQKGNHKRGPRASN